MLQGNCLAQDALPPLAFLHHPVTGEGEVDALHYATLMKAIDTAGLESVDSFTGLHNFNESLGNAGNADLWLAVAVATQSIQQQAHHLLVCREHNNGKVWNMIVFPVISAKEGEA